VPILLWRCAHGEAAPVTLACARRVAIAPLDDSVDSNAVRIKGEGVIDSFGEGPPVVKRVMFPAGVTLVHNPPRLELLTGEDRHINSPAVGLYACAGGDAWYEVNFSMTGRDELSRRIEALERRLTDIEGTLGARR
jgi:hypothetical protein